LTLLARTVSGVSWTTGSRIAQLLIQVALSIFLMRLLGPESFGLIAMVLVFTGFAGIFSQLGFSSALVQRKSISEEHRSTVFWLTILLGLFLAIALLLASPFIALFYDEPLLRPLTAWVAPSFLLAAPGLVPRSLLQREMRFDRIAKVDVFSVLASGVAAAVSAWFGAGVWSLVIQQLVYAGLGSGATLLMVGWRPRWVWSAAAIRELAGYGVGLTGFAIVNYWARSADKLLIGRFIGTGALGLYSRAYFLMLLPLSQIVAVLGPVMLPALSSIKDDKERVRRAYLRAMRLITFLSFPLMFGLAVVAEPFVMGLLGPEWTGVVPLIQILAFVGMIQSICNPVGWIYTSQGRTDWMFWWGIAGGSTLIASIVIGILLGGVVSVAWAYLVGNLLILIPCIAIPGRLIGMRARDVFREVAGNLACATGMAGLVWVVARRLPEAMNSLLALVILVSLGVIAYAAIVLISRQPALNDFRGLARQAAAPVPSEVYAGEEMPAG